MAEQIHKHAASQQDPAGDDLDRALDAVLVKYAAVEPRRGLEERILANLRTSPQPANRARWRSSLALAAAAVVVLAAVVGRRSVRPSHPVIANQPPVTTQSPRQPEKRMANRDARASGQRGHVPIRKTTLHRQPDSVLAAQPKLDVFPSPQPLNEQEKILASYVASYPEDAALIAEARMEALRKDREEKLRESTAAGDMDSQLR